MIKTQHFKMVDGNLVPGPPEFALAEKYEDPGTVFESIRWRTNRILLEEYHEQRWKKSIEKFHPAHLKYKWSEVKKQSERLLETNKSGTNVRIRLAAHQNKLVLECWSVSPPEYSETGIEVDIFEEWQKPINDLSKFKTGNRMLYVEAIKKAKNLNKEELLIVNQKGNVCEATVSNLFWVKSGNLFTTPESEGPVAGVIRAFLIDNFYVKQQPLHVEELMSVDEVFLVNAIRGIRWVQKFRNSRYSNKISRELFDKLSRHIMPEE